MADRGEFSRGGRLAVQAVRTVALLAFVLLLAYEATTAAAVVGVVTLVGTLVVQSRMSRNARRQRQQSFEQWAQARGLRLEDQPLAAPHRFLLLREAALSIARAATGETAGGRVTIMEWSYSTGSRSSRHVRLTGLVLATRPTGSHLLLRPAGRFRAPRLPGTAPAYESGHPALDEAYTITLDDPHDPAWLGGEVAGALAALARRRATVEVRDGTWVVKCLQLSPSEWEPLVTEGERLVAAVERAVSRSGR